MIAEQNPYFDQAANCIYELTESERIRQQCEAREDYLRCQADVEYLLSKQAAALSAKDKQISSQAAAISAKDKQICSQAAEITKLKAELAKALGNNT